MTLGCVQSNTQIEIARNADIDSWMFSTMSECVSEEATQITLKQSCKMMRKVRRVNFVKTDVTGDTERRIKSAGSNA